MKQQVVVIHGGHTFETYEGYIEGLQNCKFDFERMKQKRWKDSLADELGKGFEILQPVMPCKENAKYAEWKIWFERMVLFFDGAIFVGHSLGGIFLAKYLSENTYPKRITATFLIAAPFHSKESDYSLADFVLPETLKKFKEQGGKIFIYHSKDDPVVSIESSDKYAEQLPGATIQIFEDKKHFNQETFSELVEAIKSF